MHLFHGAHNVVRTNSSLSWTSAINGSGFPAKAITPLKTSDVPEYSSPTFTISESNNEGMILDNVTFTSASFCVAFRISINHPNQTQEATILSIFESSSGDGFKFQVNSGQFTQGTALVQIDDDNDGNDEVGTGTDILFNNVIPPDPNLNPLSECSLAIVNDAVNNKITLKILASDSSTVQTYTIEGSSHSNQFIDAKIYFGCHEIRQGFNFPFKGMAGTISHIAIYDSALTPTDVDEVLLDIKEL